MRKYLVLATWALVASPLWAATQTITLSIPGMNCPTCPITVKKALNRVDGVSHIDVNLRRREAHVTFDSTKATVEDLARASRNAGFPATVAGAGQ